MKNIINSGDYSTSFNPFVYAEIPRGSACLDVGCWTGNLGRELVNKKHCKVDGIDARKDVLIKAKGNGYNNTFLINLNAEDLDLDKLTKKYNSIIFADVLEHLIDPETILSRLKKNLKPDGEIIISLPNVAFILNRLLLLCGRWEYTEFGTLDKTHLRFYTIKSVVKMVEAAGYKTIKVKPYNQFGVLRHLNFITSIFPTLFSYQIMIIARK